MTRFLSAPTNGSEGFPFGGDQVAGVFVFDVDSGSIHILCFLLVDEPSADLHDPALRPQRKGPGVVRKAQRKGGADRYRPRMPAGRLEVVLMIGLAGV